VRPKAKLNNAKDIFEALGKHSAGASWNGAYYTDANTGVKARNELLVYMDTYVFGKGYMGTTKLKIPGKYITLK
jgi:hypothetical protein